MPHRSLRLPATLLSLLLVAGCALDAGVRPTTAPVQHGWVGAEARSAPLPPVPDWWRGFGSLELNALQSTARADNLEIAAAVARIEQADALVRVAGANLLPSVDFGGSGSRSRSAAGESGNSRYANRFGLTLSASYEVDFWGKNAAATRTYRMAARFGWPRL